MAPAVAVALPILNGCSGGQVQLVHQNGTIVEGGASLVNLCGSSFVFDLYFWGGPHPPDPLSTAWRGGALVGQSW